MGHTHRESVTWAATWLHVVVTWRLHRGPRRIVGPHRDSAPWRRGLQRSPGDVGDHRRGVERVERLGDVAATMWAHLAVVGLTAEANRWRWLNTTSQRVSYPYGTLVYHQMCMRKGMKDLRFKMQVQAGSCASARPNDSVVHRTRSGG